jgi:hypothetical protein
VPAVQIHSEQRSQTFSGSTELTVELAKMLALVAPSSMTTEQQEMWLRAAVDALDGIGADEVREVSAQVRRTVIRHTQVVPEIAKLVAERRAERSRIAQMGHPLAHLPSPPPQIDSSPLTDEELERMPRYLREVGLRVGYLKMDGDRLVNNVEWAERNSEQN